MDFPSDFEESPGSTAIDAGSTGACGDGERSNEHDGENRLSSKSIDGVALRETVDGELKEFTTSSTGPSEGGPIATTRGAAAGGVSEGSAYDQ